MIVIMKKTMKKYLMMLFLTLSITLLPMGGVKAALQANPNTHVKKTDAPTNWMSNIRKMEETNGSMGLSESLNSDLTSKESNNIDVHMQKNTEYGALAILSASSYGNPNKVNDGETTTGNATGVVMKLNSEWVAVGNLTKATNYYNSALRYKNVYKESIDSGNSLKYIKMIGDAITETQNWYGGSATFMYRRNL